MNPLRAIRWAWLLALSLAAPAGAATVQRADSAIQAWALRARHAMPTVTPKMGDVGGKYFGAAPNPEKTRRYYVAAEVTTWDFAPGKLEAVCGMPVSPALVGQHTATKIRYFQYTDGTFTTRVMDTPRLGVLGPVLRGVVGETLAVTFLNRTSYPLSMHPHGVKYDKDSEGAFYSPDPGLGSAVGPGARFTYVWGLDEQSGPLPGEPSSKCWLYHSHVSGDTEANLGLVGLIIVTDPARARADGTPNDVDREMATLFMVFSESGFDEAAEEAAERGVVPAEGPSTKTSAQTLEAQESGYRYAINGYIYGTLPDLEMNEGERVRWYLLGLGDEVDMHTAHWHGLRVIEENRRRTDVVELLPATMKVADMIADNPGTWLFHCHVAEHMQNGMFSRLVVHPRSAPGTDPKLPAAFFGLPNAIGSLRLSRAEAIVDPAPNAAKPREIRLAGKVTVFDAFSVFNAPVRLQLGDQSATLKPGISGAASADGVTYRVGNGSPYGVVYGGLMEWEATFTGEKWLGELEKLGVGKSGPGTALPVPFQMDVGSARHAVQASVLIKQKDG